TRKQLPRYDEIPFDSAHRFMATLHRSCDDAAFILIKGAPERVLEMCGAERTGNGDRLIDRGKWQRRAEEFAAHGYRVLSLAIKPVGTNNGTLSLADVERDATLLG